MSLVIVQVPTMGSAYLSLSLLSEVSEIYEMIPNGYGATLLVRSEKSQVEDLLNKAKVEYNIDGYLQGEEEKVLRALYSIDHSALKEALLVLESISPGDLLLWAHQGVESGLEIVDLKIPRGSQVIGSVLLTGSIDALKSFEEKPEWIRAKIQKTFIKVTPALEKFFDISPK